MNNLPKAVVVATQRTREGEKLAPWFPMEEQFSVPESQGPASEESGFKNLGTAEVSSGRVPSPLND